MSDANKAIETILDFLSDDTKKILLVKGYDDIAKLKVVLSCLNKKFDKRDYKNFFYGRHIRIC
nr:hypothetical protein [Paenibacillus xylanexedens]